MPQYVQSLQRNAFGQTASESVYSSFSRTDERISPTPQLCPAPLAHLRVCSSGDDICRGIRDGYRRPARPYIRTISTGCCRAFRYTLRSSQVHSAGTLVPGVARYLSTAAFFYDLKRDRRILFILSNGEDRTGRGPRS